MSKLSSVSIAKSGDNGGCGCAGPVQTSLWTPISSNAADAATDYIQPGENIDCFAKRVGDVGPKDDATVDLQNRIQNTSITADANLRVSEKFVLSKGPRSATSWTVSVEVPGLELNAETGDYVGTVTREGEGKTYKIRVAAHDVSGEIDSREFTFVPVKPRKDQSLTFIKPYVPASGAAKIKSGFGPRVHPLSNRQQLHKGQDWIAVSPAAKGKGTIVAVADGEVVSCGNDPGGYGLNVRINHKSPKGDLLCMTLYAHCSSILVKPGQKVAQGQSIAKEGSTGASTGPHLHFEMRLAGVTPVDPTPYFSGSVVEVPPIQADSTQPAERTRVNTAPVLTSQEVAARIGACPEVIDNTSSAPSTYEQGGYEAPFKASCTPPADKRITAAEAAVKIRETLDSHGTMLTEEDKRIILMIARIESGYDPYAKNPNSSALGLFQMIDSTATRYYGLLGQRATCENRTDPVLATRTMILFYTRELKQYWTEYKSSGTLAGKPVVLTPHTERYASLTAAEFMYGLIHHDGVGNAVRGVDKGGVAYFKRRAQQTGFA
jgi:murein DD-endopeptidase MepM/ murein hydrolase activator NlpD